MPSPNEIVIPDKVDLREFLWPVENAGHLHLSGEAAALVALEYHANRIGEPATNLSTLFVHYNARLLLGRENDDVGTNMPVIMDAIAKYGACKETTWPTDRAKLTVKPPQAAYEEAKKFAGIAFDNPRDAIEALALRYPVPVLTEVPQRCWNEAGRTGTLPQLTADEQATIQTHPGYGFALVGYDKAKRAFIARGWEGTGWGERGDFWIPFDVMSILAKPGERRIWYIAKAEAHKGSSLDAPRPAVGNAAPMAPAPAAPAAPAAQQPESMADMAARLRAEIRGDLQRDLNDASKRIRDMVARPAAGAAPPAPAVPQGGPVAGRSVCSACYGGGRCNTCMGLGCGSCKSTGTCQVCEGKGFA